MQILTSQEQENFNKPPLFDFIQRKQFFDLPKNLVNIACSLRNPTNQIGFLLLCGYFKATKRFFLPQDFHERDIVAAANILNYSVSEFIAQDYKKVSRIRHQQIITEYYRFQAFNKTAKTMIKHEIDSMSSYYLKPRLIFDRCNDILIQKRITLPESWTICELIRQSLQSHKKTLMLRMSNHLTSETSAFLDSLFTQDQEGQSYRLTLLKRLSQSTKPTKVRECVKDFHVIAVLHEKLSDTLDILKLGLVGIHYYAGSVMKSQIFQIQQRSAADRYIHASAFVAHQYYRMQDNLVDIFLNVMTAFQTTIANERKDKLLEKQESQKNQLQTLMQNLENGIFSVMQEIRIIANDSTVPDSDKIYRIKKALDSEKPLNIDKLREEFIESSDDSILYDLQENKSLRLQNRLSSVLKSLNLQAEQQKSPLIEAIDHFSSKNGYITEQAPLVFLDEPERKALYREDGTFRISLYKVFLFKYVAAAIKSGKLNLMHSYKYRPLDDYMISRKRWAKEKN